MSMDVKGEASIAVPAQGDFKVLDVVAVYDAQQYASVQFSDMIAVGQDLNGLISISGQSDISFTINGSEVKVFGNGKLDGNYTVNVNAGIKNTWGDILDKGFAANINFENKMPSVKIHGKGNILPNSGRLVLPFESINLNAVDISIIKIYENNVPQFLQENNLGGNSELRRVGKPIVQKTLRLDDDKTLDLHKKQHFSLDIDKYLKTEQGAIYKVTIGFRPEYSLIPLHAIPQQLQLMMKRKIITATIMKMATMALMKTMHSGTGTIPIIPLVTVGSRRDDPSSKSYYNKDRWATRNILASNIGLNSQTG